MMFFIYRQALWIKTDDQFCTEMLTLALSDECRLGINPKVETIRSQLFTWIEMQTLHIYFCFLNFM